MPMTAPHRRQSEKPRPAARPRNADRKRQLLAQAKQLFGQLGYQATTTEQIAAAAGVAEPILYRHFENKQALFLELLRELRAATLQRWATETVHLTDPLAKLHAVADLYFGTAQDLAVELRALHRTLLETDDEQIAAALRAFYLDVETLLAQIIADGQQSGVFRRSPDPRVGAWELIRSALGYHLTLPLSIPLYQEPDYVPRAIDCLLHCLLKTDI